MVKTESIFMETIYKGISNGIISTSPDGSKVVYFCCREFSANFKDPEEKIRAAYFVELILDYNYPQNKIDFEVVVPRRTPEDKADIVVYEDDELKKPYLVVECKKDLRRKHNYVKRSTDKHVAQRTNRCEC